MKPKAMAMEKNAKSFRDTFFSLSITAASGMLF